MGVALRATVARIMSGVAAMTIKEKTTAKTCSAFDVAPEVTSMSTKMDCSIGDVRIFCDSCLDGPESTRNGPAPENKTK